MTVVEERGKKKKAKDARVDAVVTFFLAFYRIMVIKIFILHLMEMERKRRRLPVSRSSEARDYVCTWREKKKVAPVAVCLRGSPTLKSSQLKQCKCYLMVH